ILSPLDECRYWHEVSLSGSRLDVQERAQHFLEYLKPIENQFENIDSLSLGDGIELVEQLQDSLDDLWKQTEFPEYPETRMINFFTVIGDELCRFAQRKLDTDFTSIWESSFIPVRESLRQSVSLCDRWVNLAATLTSRLWKQYPSHPWKSGKYKAVNVINSMNRFQEVCDLRTVHEHLLKLLSTTDRDRLCPSDILSKSFSKIAALHYNPYTEPTWRSAVACYERALQPAEEAVAGKLRRRLHDSSGNFLHEFQRYNELIKRPRISQTLTPERETLLGQLTNYAKNLKSEFRERSRNGSSGKTSGKNLSEVVSTIIWVRQLEGKLEEILKSSSDILGSLTGFDRFKDGCTKTRDEMNSYRQEQFQSWSGYMMSSLDDPNDPISLQNKSRVMELDHRDGRLTVHYSDGTVAMLREVRQLAGLGHRVPSKLQHAAAHAQKFYRHAVVLKQVAHFYNTIDQQMIPSQRPLMLESALNFERTIKKPKAGSKVSGDGRVHITWDRPEELEEYITKLQQAADKLTTENRRLRKQHNVICDKVSRLMSVDLLRNQQKWKDSLSDVRKIISEVQRREAAGEEASVRPWRAHWNRQIYKALEHQYQMGLQALNHNLPEIRVELTFRQGRLQFRPAFEEIRAKFYREMKRFIGIPGQFRGVTEVGDDPAATGQIVFPNMIDRNAENFYTIYSKAEDLFRRLARVKTRFEEWVVLGKVDIEDLVANHCVTYEDYERNFKTVKLKGKEIEKLPASEKVDCLTVSTSPVKSAIDDQLQKLFDTLIESLRTRVTTDVQELSNFVATATDSLQTMPQTIQEIGLANAKHSELKEATPAQQVRYAGAEKLDSLLRKMCGEGVGASLSSLRSKWDSLDILMQSHQEVIRAQISVMKAGVESRVESFLAELEKFSARWNQLKPGDDVIESGDKERLANAVKAIKERKEEFAELNQMKEQLLLDCKHFELPEPDFTMAEEIRVDLEGLEVTWLLYEDFHGGLGEMAVQDWISFRGHTHVFEEFLITWEDRLRQQDPTMMSVKLQKDIAVYKEIVPGLKYVRGEHLSHDHWLDLFRLIGLPRGTTLERLTFRDILTAAPVIASKLQELKELNSRAQGEVSIREALRELELWGAGAVFTFTEYQDSSNKSIRLIKEWKDLLNEVGDNQCLLQSLKDSPYYSGFEDKAGVWERKLVDLDEHLRQINAIQRKWVYLEPIFGHGALPREQARFERVDVDFRVIMSDIGRDGRVLSIVGHTGLRGQLSTMLDQLQRCQRSLNEYLEEKRNAFPRFYFIGDDDLLEILGQSTNPSVIQSHLKKLFAGIHSVQFNTDDSNKQIVAMNSLDGEVVPLMQPVYVTADVEEWLMNLSDQMKETLRILTSNNVRATNQDPAQFPSQILCLGEQIAFAKQCEASIRDHKLSQLRSDLEKKLRSYTSAHVLDLKLKSLILDIIHNIDVVEQLNKAGIRSSAEWIWQKQLRYYADNSASMRMVDAQFDYTFEYQGNAPKLVHTPLTDKCYLTLTQGMHMGLGGNPYGPAGTGKTESVKALGGLFGRQVLVFNCDEGIDVKSMGRIFIGLVKCGAWGCFDEFNRLEEVVLSTVSMDIQVIQAALKSRASNIELLGRQVDINPNSGIFITMNPAGKGYGGRQKLPDNLKQLFRPVAMSKPDNEQIAEVILFSEGFGEGKALGRKLVAVFNLAKELLTPQQHYDWGLRALKTVLRGSGQALHNLRRKSDNNEAKITPDDECRLVVQALRINTLSKLSFADSQRFDALVKDVFPNIVFQEIEQESLLAAIDAQCTEMHLDPQDRQKKKILELNEQLQQRMGVVIVGPSGSGKTSLWQVLRGALSRLGRVVKLHTMNPKSMPRNQLLGKIDLDTREWSDGVLTNSARDVVREPLDVHSWIVCDGDIDPEWIESLNSVLDDNHLLTMPSGERIQFGPNVNFLFETHDLSCASPATISRMGMIFLSEEDTDVTALVRSWLKKQPEVAHMKLQGWMEDYFYRALKWVRRSTGQVVDCSMVGLVLSALSHLNGCSDKLAFVVGLIRGLGGNLSSVSRNDLAKEILQWAHEAPPDARNPTNVFYNEKTGRLDSYHLDVNSTMISPETVTSMEQFPMIETIEMQRCIDHIMQWMKPSNRHPFVVVGHDGCGKSLLLHHCFDKLRSTQVATIHCSAQTTPVHLIQKLQQACMAISGGSGRALRPRECENLVLYLKDINLPKPDKWGTSQTLAFLQQLLTYHGFYDEDNEWVGLDGIQIVASLNAAATLGRHKLSSRFTSRVRILSMDYADTNELSAIYTAYLTPVLHHRPALQRHPVWGSPSKVQQLATSMVQVNKYKSFHTRVGGFDDHGHYLFTPRDLTSWCVSLMRYDEACMVGDGRAPDSLLSVWVYEAYRLFRDRIVGGKGKDRFDQMLSSILAHDWSINASECMNNDYYVTWGARQELKGALPIHGKTLGHLSASDLKDVITKAVAAYSREVREIDILVFQEVLEYMARVDRVISAPGGSLLLAGRTGVGRRTAVSVCAHMHRMTLVTPKVSRSYGLKQFKIDLKAVMQQAGIDGEQVVLLMEDFQLVHHSFLELVNSLLSAGEVPGLYNSEELDPLLTPLKDEASEAGHRGPLYAYFAKKVMSNLHVVLIMDSTHEQFTINCESNPALYKLCHVQWMDQWDKHSMQQVPEMLLSKQLPADSGGSAKQLCHNFVKIHTSCGKHRHQDATPRRYMTFLRTYQSVFQTKRDDLMRKQSHLQAGLSKLNEATSLVDNLKQKAAEQSSLLVQKQSEADSALKDITIAMQDASTQKNEMEGLKQKAAEERINIDKRKKAIDIELSEVAHALQIHIIHLIQTFRFYLSTLRMPPDVIRDILEGVLRLMGIFDTTWVSMKSFLAKRGVKEEIINFDARRISAEIRVSVEELLQQNARSFEMKNAQRASTAAAPLAEWVKANVKYSVVLEKIEPLEKEQNKLQRNLERAESRVLKLGKALDEVDARVLELRNKFEKRTTEAAQLRLEVEKANETIASAETLVGKLGSEHQRWNDQVKSLTSELTSLPACAQLASAFITYLPSAPEDVRREMVQSWMELIKLPSFDLRRFLSTESEQLQWKSEGLPSDDLSMENALIILQSGIRPFLVDPSSRATEWLKQHLKESRLEVVNQQDITIYTTFKEILLFDSSLFNFGADSFFDIMFPYLLLLIVGPRYVVQLGEKTVDYNEEFRLFMTTRNPHPDIPPDAASIISEVDFTTTRAGLKGQLLAITIQHEKPELEERKTGLLQKEESLKIELAKLEDSLLQQLAKAEGNILENKELLQSLNQTKASSLDITQSLSESQQMEASLDQERNAYLPLAECGSTLYFVISDLSKINNMYRFSLTAFLRLFQKSLLVQTEFSSTEDRIKSLSSHVQWLVYEHVAQSLFKADRLMFALHLAKGTKPEFFKDQEWEYFLGLIMVDAAEGRKRENIPVWIETERHRAVSMLRSSFPTLYSSLKLDDSGAWMTFARSSQCEHDIPQAVAAKLSHFQQILVVQTLRPDRLQSAMSLLASRMLGIREISPPATSLRRLHESGTTHAAEPVLIVLSPGADPSEELQELASSVVGEENYFQVAMGQGQSDVAMQLVRECARNGQWLFLKNLHLVTSWLPILEKELNGLVPDSNFRLWLTSEVHPKFPPVLLQSSLKITYEAPPGIKKNLFRTYDNWSPEFVASGTKHSKPSVTRSQALFALAWFHAVTQERRNFIPQGWTKFYEFSLGDLRAAATIIDHLFAGEWGREVQWQPMHGLMENAIYGGRVDNIFDMRVLTSYLTQYFDSDLLSASSRSRGKRLVANVTLPQSTNIKDYIDVIEKLPEDDLPSYFGLPANIERSAQRVNSQRVISQLKTLMRSVEAGAKFDREAWQSELGPILQLWKKLNQGSTSVIHAKVEVPAVSDASPVLQFVMLERYNAIKVVQKVHQTLSSLSKVMRGSQLLTTDVHKLANSILQQETPVQWHSMWEGPEDPMNYLHSLVAKTMALQGWAEKAEKGSLLGSNELNLADLFHPNTFLNAVRQQTARETRVSMDELKFACSWKGTISGAKTNVKIGGLQLEGCSFDGLRLSENQRDSPTVSAVPTLHAAWVPKDTPGPYSSNETISLPIYTSPNRESIVTCLDVPCGGQAKTWIQSGAALLLQQR
uniref:Cytoplasmic dynein 2 heavy chain 1 n=1 Tax=Ciona savignyi TaxID=51511 RepID=H2ZEZ6_CIOSA